MASTPVIESFEVLSQLKPIPNTLTDFFLVADSAQTVCSSILVSNSTRFVDYYWISIAIAGVADSPEQYLYSEGIVNGQDTFGATIGLTLNSTDLIRVRSQNGNLVFSLYGVNLIEAF